MLYEYTFLGYIYTFIEIFQLQITKKSLCLCDISLSKEKEDFNFTGLFSRNKYQLLNIQK